MLNYYWKPARIFNRAHTNGSTPLWIASQEGHAEVVKLLLEAGVDTNIKFEVSGNIYTAQITARKRGHTRIVKLLKEYDAKRVNDLSAKEKVYNSAATTKLKVLSGSMDESDIAEIRKLIDAGADVNVINKDKATPLYIASQEGHTEIVKMLLEAKADVNKGSMDSDLTPLLMATNGGHTEVVQLLLEAGADVKLKLNNSRQEFTILSIAKAGGHTRIVKLLKEYGAKEEVEGRTESTSSWYEDGYMHYEIHRTGPGADNGWYGN
ncbi:MAG: ankyrin repeat domain-containing protein [Deltaproteobacteria bacterium]|nr:ankyrin repeat domain-containing protein [Deltaproteobacteria bacterium]